MTLTIPAELLPTDGRFGSGPTRIRPEALARLATDPVMGTSHRQAPVKSLVGRIQEQLLTLHRAPEGHRVVLGNGGSTLFWDVAVSSLVRQRSAHGVFGEFSSKFAVAAARAPFLGEPVVTEVAPGGMALPTAVAGVDTYGWAHNETSTGVVAPVVRPDGVDDDALVVIDATSAAGGVEVDLGGIDAYYFAPQKNFASDGGLWFSICSPAALERAHELGRTRWIPESLSLAVAASNSAAQQTLNTPALATLVLLADQLDWMLDLGGIDAVAARCRRSSDQLYAWAEAHPLATPFVTDPALRSPVVCTIDLADEVDAARVSSILRDNGVVDTEAYRRLGRNQVRIACYAAIDPDDVSQLVRCLDWLLERDEVRRG
ncbi:phosphoserine transaminase [Aestuariimicrobium ganziense]|uniref:phosphoserine transaminase n=1 Tax=Aestuariimicrobium ganziense TaxID=2773677 RepID=UPI001942F526|nr:phosphoserine transaminase [Aestuariimicrobium ganziense]